MSDNLFTSITAVITGSFITIVLLRFLGEVMDRVQASFMDSGLYDVGTDWIGSVDTIYDVFYWACYVPLAVSIIYAFLNAKKQHVETSQMYIEDSYY